ncbi:MAG: M48 family metalloprotease [Pseudomonadota bacterium]
MKRSTHTSRLIIAVLLGAVCGIGAAAPQEHRPANVPLGLPPAQNSLPDLGSSANAGLSRADEYQIGRMVVRDLRSQNLLLDDAETADYLQSLGDRIGVEAQDGQQKLTFMPIRDKSINAFALPGGFIGIHTGLFLLTDDESELAAVMAHEIGHVAQRHMARGAQADTRSAITTIAGMVGAILVGIATGSPDATLGMVSMAQATGMQQQVNFTRMEEHEADRVGISYLAAAGFDPNGMPAFFSTMMRESGVGDDEIPSLLLTHPVDTVRIAESRSRIASMPPVDRRPDSASYPYIRERLRVLTNPPKTDLRRYYSNRRNNDAANPALQYGQALAEIGAGNGQAAVDLLKPLVNAQPQLPLLHIALAQAQMAAGHQDKAIATFEHALVLSPRNVPLSVRYAETLLKVGSAKKAHALLLDLFNNVPPTAEQIGLIARVASAAGDTADAYYYMGELHIGNGDLMLATTQLDLALLSPGITEVQRKRFTARRDEIRDFLREQRGDRSSRQRPPG